MKNKIKKMITKKNKKGISELLSYVLLITIALAMAGGVYAYLKFYVQPPPREYCDGISIAITEYSCENNEVTITIKNTGRFTTSAKVRLYNSAGLVVGEGDVYKSGNMIMELDISQSKTIDISYSDRVTRIEVVPFKYIRDVGHQFCPGAKIVESVDCRRTSATSPI